MARSRRQELGVGLLLAGALVLLGWMALKVGAISALGPRVHVTLRLKDAAGLQPGANVSVAGVKVGEIDALAIDGGTAVATLSLDPAAGLRRDVEVLVRARSLLGEKYVELVPHAADAPPLAEGDVLTADRAQTEMDEMVDLLGPVVRSLDPDALAAALDAVSGALREDPERVARMLRNADAILADGAVVAHRLPGFLDRAEHTLDGADRAVVRLSARLDEAKAPVAKASSLLDELHEAAVPLDATIAEARATLGDARSAVRKADALLGDLDGVGPDLRRIVKNVAEIDKWEIRRLLREEGILIRLHPREVVAPEAAP